MSYRNIDTKETPTVQDRHSDPEDLLFAAVAPKNTALPTLKMPARAPAIGEVRGLGTWAPSKKDCHMTLLTLVTWPH